MVSLSKSFIADVTPEFCRTNTTETKSCVMLFSLSWLSFDDTKFCTFGVELKVIFEIRKKLLDSRKQGVSDDQANIYTSMKENEEIRRKILDCRQQGAFDGQVNIYTSMKGK
jgi:hypothetical protein